MNKLPAPTVKAIVHGALAVASVVEANHARTGTRKFLLGLATGWHLFGTFYHLFLEGPV
jgi:hypothetical protein